VCECARCACASVCIFVCVYRIIKLYRCIQSEDEYSFLNTSFLHQRERENEQERVRACVHVCVCVYACVCDFVQGCVYICLYERACVCGVCVHTRVFLLHICIYLYAYIYMYISTRDGIIYCAYLFDCNTLQHTAIQGNTHLI